MGKLKDRKNKKRLRIQANMSLITRTTPKYNVRASSLSPVQSNLYTRDQETPPKVWYSTRAYHKINKAIQMCPKEVGWMGTVEEVDGGYLVTDIFVPKQIVHGAETDISAEDLAQLASEIEEPEKLQYWGHSHVNMGVSPSDQDETQTSEYLEHNDYFIRGIYNKKGDAKVDVFDMRSGIINQAVKNGVIIEKLPDEEMAAFEAIVTENVKERTYQNTYHSTNVNQAAQNSSNFGTPRQVNGNSNQNNSPRNPYLEGK